MENITLEKLLSKLEKYIDDKGKINESYQDIPFIYQGYYFVLEHKGDYPHLINNVEKHSYINFATVDDLKNKLNTFVLINKKYNLPTLEYEVKMGEYKTVWFETIDEFENFIKEHNITNYRLNKISDCKDKKVIGILYPEDQS